MNGVYDMKYYQIIDNFQVFMKMKYVKSIVWVKFNSTSRRKYSNSFLRR